MWTEKQPIVGDSPHRFAKYFEIYNHKTGNILVVAANVFIFLIIKITICFLPSKKRSWVGNLSSIVFKNK